ncbi:carbon-nitrogen hydrolase family protein [Vibrio sp. 404]|uniref:Carbon-nitrogen hydrolase family protein n=1 Tax=Vibrio marinisediminis TaxID=2758441 RepID=A0A7W2FPX7_9VIBR|nr:carbon-nitrogen hydrolase family protein [Vibrio marinisediminis]MBA5762119.1 carbon-nitrogen hydrolase family protein [Vibrio marinisediminis]
MDRVGLIQMTSGANPEANLVYIEQQVAALSEQGATWVITPENAIVLGSRSDYHHYAEPLENGEIQAQLSEMAKRYQVWLIVGSFPIQRASGVTTTLLVYNNDGALMAHYDKLHMFDVDVADSHQRYRESETFMPGGEIVSIETPFAHLGLTICYDVRFPQLYGELAKRGANVIVVPAAFTAVTGQAHWQPLLTARAIETQSWVVAVNQTGIHQGGRQTWGHSMVISPWGDVFASLGDAPSNLLVELDLQAVTEIRATMPVMTHNRFDSRIKI